MSFVMIETFRGLKDFKGTKHVYFDVCFGHSNSTLFADILRTQQWEFMWEISACAACDAGRTDSAERTTPQVGFDMSDEFHA